MNVTITIGPDLKVKYFPEKITVTESDTSIVYALSTQTAEVWQLAGIGLTHTRGKHGASVPSQLYVDSQPLPRHYFLPLHGSTSVTVTDHCSAPSKVHFSFLFKNIADGSFLPHDPQVANDPPEPPPPPMPHDPC